MDIPAFNWPQAPFPKIRYPLEQFKAENKKEEDNCLAEVEKIIKSNSVPVAGMIIEPIQGEGGDNAASPEFYRSLRALAKKNGVMFIVDEVLIINNSFHLSIILSSYLSIYYASICISTLSIYLHLIYLHLIYLL